MPNNILITPGSASIDFSGSMAGNTLANTLRLQVLSDASVVITGSVGQIARFFPSGQVWVTSSAQSSIAAHQFTGSLGIVSFIGTASRVVSGAYVNEAQSFSALQTFASGVALNDSNLTGVNNITINDPGANEGILWAGGNLWRIYESPNTLTDAAGNLQIVQNTTRRATFNTSGQLEIPVATGTAPFLISSTTVVTNLNADLLDGYNTAVLATANTVVVRDASGGMTGSIFGNATTATSASNVLWPNVGTGTRTNYDLDFKPPTSGYAGFAFTKSTSANGADDAGYLLIRGTSDSDVYTAEGITLVADGGWLTLAQRTTAGRGVKIMTGTTAANRVFFNADGTVEYTGTTYNYSNAGQILFNHTTNNTNVPFDMRKGGTTISDDGTYGVLYLSRENTTNGATGAGANLYFVVKDSGGTYREYAGIGGRKTVAGADGGALYFYRYGRNVLGYWDVNGLYATVFYDYNNSAYYINPAGNGTQAANIDGNIRINPKSEAWAEGISFNMPTQAVWGGLRWVRSYSAPYTGNWALGYFGDESNNDIGFHNGTNGWRLDHSFNMTSIGSVRSPIFYDSINTAFFLDPNAAKSLRITGGIAQNNIVGRPVAYWGATSATGAVVIKFPGGSGNYGMVHAEINIYEYNGNAAATVIVGGHNWNGAWYNINAEVIGQTDKPVRVGFKDGRYCIVIGNGSSTWSYGQVVLRKIQNGTYYDGVMEVAEGYSVAVESDSYTYISGDLRNLRTPLAFTAGTGIYAPIYYDTDDTNYFVNPRSNSRLSGLRLSGVDNQASGDDAILWIDKPNNNDWGIIITGNLDYGADFRMSDSAALAFRVLGSGNERFTVRGDGMTIIRNTAPTLTFRDTDHRTGYIHVNSNIFYVLSGPADSAHGAWTTVHDGKWALEINLTNNNASFGGNVYITANARYFGMNSTGTWGGDMGGGQGKLEYHSNRWYIAAGSDSTEIVRFRRGGTDMAYMTNSGELYAPIMYDINSSGWYVDPASTSRLSILNLTSYGFIVGQTTNGQSFYQWEGATYRNPGDHTPSLLIREDNASTGINGFMPGLALYNANGGDQTTVGLTFVSAEGATGAGNSVNLAGIIAKKEAAGNVGGWSPGSLTFFVKNYGTRVDAMYIGFDGRIGINTTDFSYTTTDNASVINTITNNRLFINGSIQLLSNQDAIVFGRGSASFMRDEEIGFGWGGGWYMVDSTYLRVRGSKVLYNDNYIRSDASFRMQSERSIWGNYGVWSTYISRIAYFSFDWNAAYDSYSNHGIASTDLNGTFTDSMSINSYNDIVLRIDTNDNNPNSYVRFMDNTTGNNQFAYIGRESGAVVAYFGGAMYASVYYDANDGNYYLDPNSTSDQALRVRGGTLYGPNVSWGKYLLVGGDGRNNRVNDGNVASVSTTNGNLHIDAASGYQLYLNYYDGNVIYFGGGDNNTWGEFSSGIFYAYNQMRSPIFYDYNNSGYYVDPNSSSFIRGRLDVQGGHGNSQIRITTNGPELGSGQTSTMTWWVSEPGVTWNAGGFGYNVTNDGGSPGGFSRLNGSYGQSYFRFDTDGNMYLYNTNTSGTRYLNMRFDPGYYVYVYNYLEAGGSLRAPIFYDSNDTGGYLDPREPTNGLRFYSSAGWWQLRGATHWDSQPGIDLTGGTSEFRISSTGGNVNLRVDGWVYAYDSSYFPFIYDQQNTGYYVDPNGSSQFAAVFANDWFRPQGCVGLYFQSYGRGLWSPECEGNPYGHVTTYGGGRQGWYGYGIGSRYTFMSTTGDNVGVHDSARGWVWYMSGAILYLYYAGSERMSMQSYGVYVNNDIRSPIFYDHDTSFYFDGNGTTSWNWVTDRSKDRIGNTFKYNNPRSNITSDSNYWIGSMGWGTTDFLSMFNWGSGFIDSWSNPANQPAGTSHWVGVQAAHYTCGYNCGYGWQMVGGPIAGLWFRNYWSSASGWKKIAMYGVNEYSSDFWASIMYDSNNGGYYNDPDGTSRMNFMVPNRMKLVNNVNYDPRWDFTAYVVEAQHWYGNFNGMTMYIGESANVINVPGTFRPRYMDDWNNTGYYIDMDGTTNINVLNNEGQYGRFWEPKGVGGDSGNYGTPAYRIFQEGGGWGFPYPDLRIMFHTGIKFGANPSYEGYRFYDDYGLGSLLMQINGGSNYNYFYRWTQLTGYHGFYSGINNAHIYPNDASYGSWRMNGTRNGWGGIYFDTGITLMMNGNEHGFWNGSWRFYVVSSNGYFPGDVTAYWSDRRLKENIRPLEDGEGLDIISRLVPSRFRWKQEALLVSDAIPAGTEEVSIIAQDTQQVLPIAVKANLTGNKVSIDGNQLTEYLTINYDKISPYLIAAIKDLKVEIDQLKEQLKKVG